MTINFDKYKIVMPDGFDHDPCFDFARRRAESYSRFLNAKIEMVIVTEAERLERQRMLRERIRIIELLQLPERLVRVAKPAHWDAWRRAVEKQWEVALMAGELIDEAEAACGVG